MAPIHFQLAPKPEAWDNIDQLAQVEIAAPDGAIHNYYLFWHHQTNMVLFEVEKSQQYYWSCGSQTLTHLIRYFQGGLEDEREFQVMEAWGGRGNVDPTTILNVPFTTIKNQHEILSVTCI